MRLARRLGLALVEQPTNPAAPLLLAVTAERLELRPTDGTCGPVCCDFTTGRLGHRLARPSPGELLNRAIGDAGRSSHVVDATAGLGRDAMLLAALGYRVTAIERHPVIAALLDDGLARAAGRAPLAAAVNRLRLVIADARMHLPCLAGQDRPDVVYLDPMFPPRGKSARVKKESYLLGRLLGPADDAADLLAHASTIGCRRLVVKRPPPVEPLACPVGWRLSHGLAGKAVRFDVYLPR